MRCTVYGARDVRNPASARVMEKIGMQRDGLLRDTRWIKGEWVSDFQYAILEDEWRSAMC